jgi:hypothetical protein
MAFRRRLVLPPIDLLKARVHPPFIRLPSDARGERARLPVEGSRRGAVGSARRAGKAEMLISRDTLHLAVARPDESHASVCCAAAIALVLVILRIGPAHAVPSFAEQTGQPCASCHVGAFGPQLTKYGRDFKLNGYVASDGKNHFPPLAVTTQLSFTHTDAAQPGPAAPHFAPNDNVAPDQTSFYYAGRIVPWLGAFVQITYDGVAKQLHIDNADIRHARDGELFDEDLVWGVTANNTPTVSDLWNSTPTWSFPYNRSRLAPTPMAASLVDGGLAQRVAGGGAYVMWNDLVYLEADLYRGLGYDVLNATGIVPVYDTDRTRGVIPYWRLALQQEFGRSSVEFGTYGLHASIFPGALNIPGQVDVFTDTALDANYQFRVNPKDVTSDMISAHATYIHENASLAPAQIAAGTRASDGLNTFRADVSYSIGATVTPTVQYFRTTGSGDFAYWGTPNGSPNSSGVITELAYVPWGKPDSPFSWFNVRVAAQYVNYFRFNGLATHASDNNALYLSIWAAAHF